MKLDGLKKEEILKSSKHPFFIFKDNRNQGFITMNLDDVQDMLREYSDEGFLNLYMQYKKVLPRANTINLVRYSPVRKL